MRRAPSLALLLAVCWWGAEYLPHLLAGRTFPARDIGATQIPWRVVWRDQVLAGVAPLWDPDSNQGRPLLANPNAMAAYPGTLLFLIASPEHAAAWHIALHHLLFLLGCYVLARRSGGDRGSAGVAAATAAGVGVVWSSATFLNAQAALAWAPWALSTAARAPAGATQARRLALSGGALLGLVFLAGEPVVAALAAFGWVVTLAFTWGGRRWSALACAMAAAAGVSAPVLLPLLTIFAGTVRGAIGAAPGALAADALAPRRWPELFLPHLLGAPFGDAAGGFWAASSFPWQRYYPTLFLGSLPLVVAPFARRSGRRMGGWWLLAALGFGLAIALGLPGVAAWARRLPGLSDARFAIKFLVLPTLALPPLLAAGFDGMRRAWLPSGRRVCLAGALLAATLLPLALAPDRLLRPLLGRAYPGSALALAAVPGDALALSVSNDALALALPPVALLLTGPAPAAAAFSALLANSLDARGVLLADRSRSWASPPTAMRRVVAEPTLAAFATAADPAARPSDELLSRFWRARAALQPGYATRWGGRYVLTRGPDGLEPVRQDLLAAAAAGLPMARRARIARALGARVVVTDVPVPGWDYATVDGVFLDSVDWPAPRAYLARRLLPAQGVPAAAQALADVTFRAGEDAVVDGTGGAQALTGGSVVEQPGDPHDLRFTTASRGPGLLVVGQSLMPCWRARVDGLPAPIEPANFALLGVELPAGRHDVELFLDPWPYRFGLVGPPLVVAALLFSLAGASRGRRVPSGEPGRSSPASSPVP